MRLPAGSKFGTGNILAQRTILSVRTSRAFQIYAGRGFSELLDLNKTSKKQGGKDTKKLTPGRVSNILSVPDSIVKPPYVGTGEMPWGEQPEIHDAEGVTKMRAACKLAAEVLKYAGTLVKVGQTTDFIDKKVHQMIVDNGAYPSPLTYGRFPKSVCTSVNECLCHGIPDSRVLQNGDIINIDVTVYLNGYHGDTSAMFYAGQPSDRAKWLCDISREAMYEGIKQCGPGVFISAIGKAINSLADRHRISISPDFIGHGVGRHFHANPTVHPTRNMNRAKMSVGQTFTIEPILVDGNPRWNQWRDGWTIVTKDGSLTAQHEHTILITENGHEILTQLE